MPSLYNQITVFRKGVEEQGCENRIDLLDASGLFELQKIKLIEYKTWLCKNLNCNLLAFEKRA